MWIRDKIGKEQIWYEEELIERIKKECREVYENNKNFYGLAENILKIIQEFEQ